MSHICLSPLTRADLQYNDGGVSVLSTRSVLQQRQGLVCDSCYLCNIRAGSDHLNEPVDLAHFNVNELEKCPFTCGCFVNCQQASDEPPTLQGFTITDQINTRSSTKHFVVESKATGGNYRAKLLTSNDEAKIAYKARHMHVLGYVGIADFNAETYLIMRNFEAQEIEQKGQQSVQARTLWSFLQSYSENSPISLQTRKLMCFHLSLAIHRLHSKSIAHLDLHYHNIMVFGSHEQYQSLTLIDFGESVDLNFWDFEFSM
jgi:serine/threonine protein kinase